jgi:hypothetical protein
MSYTLRYQPATASAAAWRDFILLPLEARIVGRDALRIFLPNIPRESKGREIVFAVTNHATEATIGTIKSAISRSRDCLVESIFTLISIIEFLHALPFSKRRIAVGVANLMWRIPYRRHDQVPAHKSERGSVAGVHCVKDLAERYPTDITAGQKEGPTRSRDRRAR